MEVTYLRLFIEFGSMTVIILGMFFLFLGGVGCRIVERGFCFEVREALAMSCVFPGGEMGLWVAFWVRLWARGGESCGM